MEKTASLNGLEEHANCGKPVCKGHPAHQGIAGVCPAMPGHGYRYACTIARNVSGSSTALRCAWSTQTMVAPPVA